jgi:hypothetical protein
MSPLDCRNLPRRVALPFHPKTISGCPPFHDLKGGQLLSSQSQVALLSNTPPVLAPLFALSVTFHYYSITIYFRGVQQTHKRSRCSPLPLCVCRWTPPLQNARTSRLRRPVLRPRHVRSTRLPPRQLPPRSRASFHGLGHAIPIPPRVPRYVPRRNPAPHFSLPGRAACQYQQNPPPGAASRRGARLSHGSRSRLGRRSQVPRSTPFSL